MKSFSISATLLLLVSLAAGQEQKSKVSVINHFVRCGVLIQPESADYGPGRPHS
jgi:hypothetical protein